ncbi:MAG TPA: HDIG domain-containing metalloprotein, partial [Pirellulaceae bacterium]
DVVAHTSFDKKDPIKTRERHALLKRSQECTYQHDARLIADLRTSLKGKLLRLVAADVMEEVSDVWGELREGAALVPPDVPLDAPAADTEDPHPAKANPSSSATEPEESDLEAAAVPDFDTLDGWKQEFADDPELAEFERRLASACEEIERFGLLDDLQHDVDEGSQTEITVVPVGGGKPLPRVPVDDVRFTEAMLDLEARLKMEFPTPGLAEIFMGWLRPRMPRTLILDESATRIAMERLIAETPDVMIHYEAGKDVLANAEKPLTNADITLLELEHKALLASFSWREKLVRAVSSAGMYLAIFVLCGTYLWYREPKLLANLRQFVTLLALMVLTVCAAQLCSREHWQAELVPLMIFGITAGISYRHEVAFLLLAAISLVVALALGKNITDFVVYAATLASTVFMLGHVRSRTKLIYVGLWSAAVAVLTTLGVFGIGERGLDQWLLMLAAWNGLLAIVGSLLMTALLPFVEHFMEIQTEISLLELGDVAHPLLQELARRAPGTYNHSISVASLAQSAAEAIHANGLLVRVGAYFHDIGKMLKPQYFVENQEPGASRHDTLLPAMSTLIIIAHVKDGADLARQHHLPQPIIDFILQHHGTTLVEYFFDRAHRQKEASPDAAHVEERSFRYPGPRPQSKEAAVLMLADAAEGAARAMHDPGPARIEGLVHDLAMKRLLDGQFDECGLTLRELHLIEASIVKSLNAMYHARVRYPDSRSGVKEELSTRSA